MYICLYTNILPKSAYMRIYTCVYVCVYLFMYMCAYVWTYAYITTYFQSSLAMLVNILTVAWIRINFFSRGLDGIDTFDALLERVEQTNLPYIGPHVGTLDLGVTFALRCGGCFLVFQSDTNAMKYLIGINPARRKDSEPTNGGIWMEHPIVSPNQFQTLLELSKFSAPCAKWPYLKRWGPILSYFYDTFMIHWHRVRTSPAGGAGLRKGSRVCVSCGIFGRAACPAADTRSPFHRQVINLRAMASLSCTGLHVFSNRYTCNFFFSLVTWGWWVVLPFYCIIFVSFYLTPR